MRSTLHNNPKTPTSIFDTPPFFTPPSNPKPPTSIFDAPPFFTHKGYHPVGVTISTSPPPGVTRQRRGRSPAMRASSPCESFRTGPSLRGSSSDSIRTGPSVRGFWTDSGFVRLDGIETEDCVKGNGKRKGKKVEKGVEKDKGRDAQNASLEALKAGIGEFTRNMGQLTANLNALAATMERGLASEEHLQRSEGERLRGERAPIMPWKGGPATSIFSSHEFMGRKPATATESHQAPRKVFAGEAQSLETQNQREYPVGFEGPSHHGIERTGIFSSLQDFPRREPVTGSRSAPPRAFTTEAKEANEHSSKKQKESTREEEAVRVSEMETAWIQLILSGDPRHEAL
ncbi:hypothetical protein ACEPPN_015769 [Leptodophora sp. 'Broadleaf-Isolate-01']